MAGKSFVIMAVCMAGGIVLDVLPEGPMTPALKRLSQLGSVAVMVWWFRLGYLRRRPHWTWSSWTRFAVCALGCLAAAGVALTIGAGVDDHRGWVGEARSTLRLVWAGVGLIGIVVGGGGLGLLLVALSAGEPERPFTWPRRQPQQ